MKQMTFRLICFVLLITQLPVFNLAQTQTDSNNQQSATKPEQRKQTESELKESLALYQKTGNKLMQANTLFNLGMLYFLQGSPAPALDYYRQSLKLNEELGNKIKIAYTFNQMSLNFRLLGDFATALDYAEKSLALSETLDNKELTANILMTYGLIQNSLDNLTEALEFYQKSLALGEELKHKGLTANALEKIGGILTYQGKFAEALNNYQRCLKLNEEIGNKRQIIFTINGIGNVHFSQGNFAQALENYERGLRLSEELGNKFQIATILTKLGIISQVQGDSEQALEYFRKSLKLSEEIGNAAGVAESLYGIAYIYRSLSDYTRALEYYHRSLKQNERLGKKSGVIIMLINIAQIYALEGNYSQASEYSRKGLELSEELRNNSLTSVSLNLLGDIYALQKNDKQAIELAQRAAALSRQDGNRYNLWNALLISGQAYGSLNEFDKARQAFEESITIVETFRANLPAEETRIKYFATVQQSYEFYIDLMMQRHQQQPLAGNDILAFESSERARARSLLELLNEANTDIRQGVEPQLLERERSLQQQLNARAEQQTRLLNGQNTNEQLTKLKKEIDTLKFEYQQTQSQIRRNSPRYAALTQPQPLKLSEIQKEVLDADTILLEYSLGEKRSYLWAVTKDSIKSYELPPRAQIEATVRRAYALLSDGKQVIDEKAQADYETEAAGLSRILLAPVAAQIQNKRIVIVADGALQYLPFGALPSPNSKESRRPPLIAENEIINLPSVSTLAVLRRQVGERRAASKTVAVVADPVFSPTDARVKAAVKNESDRRTLTPPTSIKRDFILERAAFNTELLRDGIISRLPFSRREAESILTLAPADERMQALDFEASRKTVLSPAMSQYRIVHFATHGLLNSEYPELSGIVLSLVNEEGQAVEGFLRLNEIYNLNLSADLVVLSACQTALGKEIKGEGLIGLTRGFMYAGSPRVVASLWKVDDVATAELMKIFYQKMLKEKMTTAAALRAAKIEMSKQKRWSAPFYWAAFELQGEWR